MATFCQSGHLPLFFWQEVSSIGAKSGVVLAKPQDRVALGPSASKHLPEQTQSEVCKGPDWATCLRVCFHGYWETE